MRIAIPVSNEKLSPHFGRCEQFALFDVDVDKKSISSSTTVPAPDHEPGLLPAWLHENGATVVIVGGMGPRAVALFEQAGIEVIMGAMESNPEAIVRDYLEKNLASGENVCDR